MSKKDYELIASAVWRSGAAMRIGRTRKDIAIGREQMQKLIAGDLAATLSHDNPRFDKDRFLKACGVSD